MIESLIEFLRETFPPQIGVVLAGALPVTELRAAIPLAVSMGMPAGEAFVYGVLGNMLPVPVLLWVLPKAFAWFTEDTFIGRQLNRWVERTKRRSDKVEKYGALGLALFTAVPLPTTGAWSAALAAVIFKISPKVAFFSISVGVLLAGVVITLVSVGMFG